MKISSRLTATILNYLYQSPLMARNLKNDLKTQLLNFKLKFKIFFEVYIQLEILLEVQAKSKNLISSTNLRFQVEK